MRGIHFMTNHLFTGTSSRSQVKDGSIKGVILGIKHRIIGPVAVVLQHTRSTLRPKSSQKHVSELTQFLMSPTCCCINCLTGRFTLMDARCYVRDAAFHCGGLIPPETTVLVNTLDFHRVRHLEIGCSRYTECTIRD